MSHIPSEGYIELCLTVANPDEPMQKFSTVYKITDRVDFESGILCPYLQTFLEHAECSLHEALIRYSKSK